MKNLHNECLHRSAIIPRDFKKQRDYFKSQATKSVAFRRTQLKKLKEAIQQYEEKILEALNKDLGKSKEEAYLTEISIVVQELQLASL